MPTPTPVYHNSTYSHFHIACHQQLFLNFARAFAETIMLRNFTNIVCTLFQTNGDSSRAAPQGHRLMLEAEQRMRRKRAETPPKSRRRSRSPAKKRSKSPQQRRKSKISPTPKELKQQLADAMKIMQVQGLDITEPCSRCSSIAVP